jgi:alkylated DNA repair dioxygenase AlkB
MKQVELFASRRTLPEGFEYQPDFLTEDEETALLATLRELPLAEATYKQYTARRRIVSYGGRYDFSAQELLPAGPIPPFLFPVRERIATWTGIPASDLTHALVAEYRPGTPLGWHRDVPDFEAIVGLSLAGRCRMRLRPYPPKKGRRNDALAIELEPRSAYWMSGDARWRWQHAVSPTKALRYSITFRTRAAAH